MRAQALECLGAQDLGELYPPRPGREVEVEDIPAQGLGREELQPRRRLSAGTPRQASLDEEMVQGGTNLLRTQAIWRALGELGSAGHRGHRGLVGFWGQPLQWHIVEHLGTSRCYEELLCLSGGTDPSAPSGRWDGATIRNGCVVPKRCGGSRGFQQPIEGQESASKERTEQRMTARELPRSGLVQPLINRPICPAKKVFLAFSGRCS
jgi:hypothetical protein